MRLVASRGSMDLGESQGGLPPDELDGGTGRRARRHGAAGRARRRRPAPARRRAVLAVLGHEGADDRVGGARAAARAAPAHAPGRDGRGGGLLPRALRLHAGRVPRPSSAGRRATSGARTASTCPTPTSATFAREGVGVAHCPTSNLRLGAGVARVRDLVDAGVRVGLGVDGSASNERSDLCLEVKQALLVARGRGGPEAMTAREALRLGTRGGAAVLGRDDIGSLEPGKRADIAVWRTDGLELGGADDLVAGWVLSGPHRVDRLYVGGRGGRARRTPGRGRRGGDRSRSPRPGAKILGPMTISTHVLDTERGGPAAGVRVELYRGADLVGVGTTDVDGRIVDLSGGQSLGPGRYRLVFSEPPSRFFRRVELEIDLDDADRHYHVPLLVSPTRARATAAAERGRAGGAVRGPDALRRAAGAGGRPARPRAHARPRAALRGEGRGPGRAPGDRPARRPFRPLRRRAGQPTTTRSCSRSSPA